MKVHYNIKVTGVVQGVWFRKSTKDRAESLGVTGFVRNEPDGSVYIEAEGESGNVRQLINWCHKGPTQARVDHVDSKKGDLKGYQKFELQR